MSYLESEALCPYYESDKFGILHCEIGNLRMRDSQMLREVGYGVCADKYKTCPFKVALDNYYERSGADVVPEAAMNEQVGLW